MGNGLKLTHFALSKNSEWRSVKKVFALNLRAHLLASVLAGLILTSAPLLAQESIDMSATDRSGAPSEPQHRNGPTGVANDEPILIKVGETVFQVPAAYLTAWPTKDMIGKINGPNSPDGLSFTFWMPDRRPVEVKTMPPLISRAPAEPGRPAPPPSAFVVLVNDLRIVNADGQNYMSPEKQFRNSHQTFGGPGDVYR